MFDRIKSLFRNLVIYGMGDVATSLVSLLLLPVYTRFLSPSDYGVIAMLLTVEAVAKVVFRWGVDTAFMRLYLRLRGSALAAAPGQHDFLLPARGQRSPPGAGDRLGRLAESTAVRLRRSTPC